jgi:hypothetical protein
MRHDPASALRRPCPGAKGGSADAGAALGEKQRREIAESVISGRKSGAEMARLYHVSEPTKLAHRRRAPTDYGATGMKRCHDLTGLMKFATRPEWADDLSDALDDHPDRR